MDLDPTDVYFTFPDRGLAYDCRGCGACCRGLGIGLDAAGGQLAELCELYPDLGGFVRRRGAAVTAFNPRGRCWFLADDGLCRIERDHGRRVKPAACRLFPFNRVFRLGGLMVVDFNSVVCPLRPAGDQPEPVVHAELTAEIAQIADPAVIATPLPAADPEAEGRALLQRESAIADACFAAAAAGPPDLEAAWWAQLGDDPVGAAWRAEPGGLAAATELLFARGVEPPGGATAAAALLLTPSLRFNELFGPRQYAPSPVMIALLPRVWRAWLELVAAGARLAERDLTVQEVTSSWAEAMPLAYLMARFTDRCALAPGPAELPGPDADPGGVVRRFGEQCVANRDRRRTLGELLEPLLAGEPLSNRVALARLIEPLFTRLDFGDGGAARAPRSPARRKRGRRR